MLSDAALRARDPVAALVCLPGPALATETYDSVADVLRDAKQTHMYGKVLLRGVLVVSGPDEVEDDDYDYMEEFLLSRRAG